MSIDTSIAKTTHELVSKLMELACKADPETADRLYVQIEQGLAAFGEATRRLAQIEAQLHFASQEFERRGHAIKEAEG